MHAAVFLVFFGLYWTCSERCTIAILSQSPNVTFPEKSIAADSNTMQLISLTSTETNTEGHTQGSLVQLFIGSTRSEKNILFVQTTSTHYTSQEIVLICLLLCSWPWIGGSTRPSWICASTNEAVCHKNVGHDFKVNLTEPNIWHPVARNIQVPSASHAHKVDAFWRNKTSQRRTKINWKKSKTPFISPSSTTPKTVWFFTQRTKRFNTNSTVSASVNLQEFTPHGHGSNIFDTKGETF